jgi:hypothetical protein
MPGQIRLRIRCREYATPWFDYLFVSRKELERLLAGTGWALRRSFPQPGGRYIAVLARRD